MSLNLANLFSRNAGPKPANQQQQQQQQQQSQDPNNPGGQQGDPNNPNNIDPSKSKVQPLDMFKGMWDTSNTKGKEDAPPAFKLDPEKLKTLASSLDFTSAVTPELQEKLKSGDPEAMKLALNSVGQNAYSMIFEHLPALTEAYVGARLDHDRKGLDRSVKSTLTKQSLEKLAANNPVLKRQIDVIGEQLLTQFPDASPDWIAEQVPAYFTQVAKLLAPDQFKLDDKQQQQQDDQRNSFKWEDWISGQGGKPSNNS